MYQFYTFERYILVQDGGHIKTLVWLSMITDQDHRIGSKGNQYLPEPKHYLAYENKWVFYFMKSVSYPNNIIELDLQSTIFLYLVFTAPIVFSNRLTKDYTPWRQFKSATTRIQYVGVCE